MKTVRILWKYFQNRQDRAFEWLEKAFEKRETPLIHLTVGWGIGQPA